MAEVVNTKYEQVANEIREAIENGTLAPGAKLRPERQMMADYGVSYGTVRKAVESLRAEGLVIAVHGSGVYVAPKPPIQRKASDRFLRSNRDGVKGKAAFLSEVEAEGRTATVEIVHIGEEKAPNRILPLLKLRKGAKVLVRSRLYFTDGIPVETATSFIPWSIAKGTAMVDDNPGPGGVYARIEEAGLWLEHFTEDVYARMPNPIEVAQLELSDGVPVMDLVRVAYAKNDKPVEVCETVMAANRFVLSYRFPAQ